MMRTILPLVSVLALSVGVAHVLVERSAPENSAHNETATTMTPEAPAKPAPAVMESTPYEAPPTEDVLTPRSVAAIGGWWRDRGMAVQAELARTMREAGPEEAKDRMAAILARFKAQTLERAAATGK